MKHSPKDALSDRAWTSWNVQRRIASVLVLVFMAGLFSFILLRFEPQMNRVFEGRPAYMRHVAEHVGASLAAQEHLQTAVIVAGEAKHDCRTVPNASSFGDQKIFFVVTYTERSHSFCVTQYGLAVDAQAQGVITLSEESGRNYGARIQLPVQVAPIGHVFKVLPDFVVSLIDWRTPLPSSAGNVAFDSQTNVSSAGQVSDTGLDVNFFEIRAALKREHDHSNILLEIILAGLALAVLVSIVWMSRVYGAFRLECSAYNRDINLRQFFSEDLDNFVLHLERDHRLAIEKSQAQSRDADTARRHREELRLRLSALLEGSTDDAQRQEILDTLNEDNHASLESLVHRIGTRPKSSDERLRTLLQSLKEYCRAEELQQHEDEAMELLHTAGFRPAREFVVRLHEELRARAREVEHAEAESERDEARDGSST